MTVTIDPADLYEPASVDEGWPGVMNELFCLSVREDVTFTPTMGTMLEACITAAENEFCLSDRRAYRVWAASMSKQNGFLWEPCRAWDEGSSDDESWLTEAECGLVSSDSSTTSL